MLQLLDGEAVIPWTFDSIFFLCLLKILYHCQGTCWKSEGCESLEILQAYIFTLNESVYYFQQIFIL